MVLGSIRIFHLIFLPFFLFFFYSKAELEGAISDDIEIVTKERRCAVIDSVIESMII